MDRDIDSMSNEELMAAMREQSTTRREDVMAHTMSELMAGRYRELYLEAVAQRDDLLAALMEMVALVERMPNYSSIAQGEGGKTRLEQARAAIARARQEA